MAWHSDFNDDSSCLQYFRNLGSETSTTLVCRFAQHCAQQRPGDKRDLAVNTQRKVMFVKATVFNAYFARITKSDQELV
jgi:hypothetical protein